MNFVIGNVRCSPFFVSVIVNTLSDQSVLHLDSEVRDNGVL